MDIDAEMRKLRELAKYAEITGKTRPGCKIQTSGVCSRCGTAEDCYEKVALFSTPTSKDPLDL
jgi:hypothetical protein